MPYTPPKDTLNQSNKEMTKGVAEVNKQLKDSVKSTADLNKNFRIINDALKNKTILEREANKLLDEQIDKYVEYKNSIRELSGYLSQITDKQKDHLKNLDVKITQEKASNELSNKRVTNLAYEIEEQQKLTDLAKEQNKEYVLRDQKLESQLDRIYSKRANLLNVMQDKETKSEEERVSAREEYIRLLEREDELQEKQEKRKEDNAWTRFRAEQIKQADAIGDTRRAQQLRSGDVNAPIKGYRYDERSGEIKELTRVSERIGDKLASSKIGDKLDKIGLGQERLTQTLASGFNAMNAMIDHAINVVQTGYGSVTAAVDGTGQTFDDIRKNLVSGAGISSLVRQEDLLNQVTSIAKEGISTDIESIAILSTIRDKTVASFQATDGNLRRLVRLNQNLGNLTAKQFGLAAVLRTELNEAFGDSSFIGRQFQQLTGTLLDAVSMNALKGGTDSTNFYAVMETFAGGLYEAGVDEGTVSALAQGINYLGSGNIGALSGNTTLQNLLLLSMDRVGMDYATILQQGLTTDDTYLLLQSIIDYLAEIAEQNKENNVLQSSYANLFNLSVTDMTAIRNLSKNNVFRNYAAQSTAFNNNTAMQAAINEINAVSERTMFSEKMTNLFENAKFTMGAGIASSPLALATNLISRYGVQAGAALSDIGLTKVGKATSLASGVAWGLSLLGGIDDLLAGLKTSFSNIGSENNTLSDYFLADFSENGGMYDFGKGGRNFANQGSGLKTFDAYSQQYGSSYDNVQNKYMEEKEVWEQEQKESEQDPNTKILKELQKTLMDDKNGHYAFAVQLQGMSDSVLASFASIFTENDDEIEIKGGKVTNNSLAQNNSFIDYASDTSTAK